MTSIQLSNKILVQIKSVLKQFPEVEKAFIFGSRANGSAKRGADIDLAIQAPELVFAKYVSLRRLLNDLLIYEVDVVHLDTTKDQDFIRAIQRSSVKFYDKSRDKAA